MKQRYLYACLLALMCGNSLADGLYRWVDKSGKVYYGDTPATGAAKVEQKKFSASPTVDVNYLTNATRNAKKNFPVTLYVADSCKELCKEARLLLNKRGIPFTENILRTKEELDAFKQLSGGEVVPTLKVGNTWFKGFQAEQWGGGLDTAGYSQTPSH